MSEWKNYVDGLSKLNRGLLYPGMHKNLIPATEMIDSMDRYKIGLSGSRKNPYQFTFDQIDSSDGFGSSNTFAKTSGVHPDETSGFVSKILNHPNGLGIVGECAREHFGLTALGGSVTASGARVEKRPLLPPRCSGVFSHKE